MLRTEGAMKTRPISLVRWAEITMESRIIMDVIRDVTFNSVGIFCWAQKDEPNMQLSKRIGNQNPMFLFCQQYIYNSIPKPDTLDYEIFYSHRLCWA